MKGSSSAVSPIALSLVGQIQALSIQLSMSGKAFVNVDYSGHVNQLSVRVYGSTDCKDTLLVSSFYLEGGYERSYQLGLYDLYPGMEVTMIDELNRIVDFLLLTLSSEFPSEPLHLLALGE